ncbi:hypothetical protein [Nocardioides sp. Leaf285]|uniref:hypothetical protein n=1 Tax=Nocardioides sp. Leaf285 TaxID=1736322 RepID=UPI00070297D7|nr:hypothetical protein [Nocardioides sp. Leaf285]KQP62918.1 hypothetical protein ASF47_18065 [Nocardioides sp. Leaf285]
MSEPRNPSNGPTNGPGETEDGADTAAQAEALAANPGLLASIFAPLVGLDGSSYTPDGFYWPFADLTLRCPRCPSCGSSNGFPFIAGIHPRGMCTDDDCHVLMWDPTRSAQHNLGDALQMVDEVTPDGTTVSRPGPRADVPAPERDQ